MIGVSANKKAEKGCPTPDLTLTCIITPLDTRPTFKFRTVHFARIHERGVVARSPRLYASAFQAYTKMTPVEKETKFGFLSCAVLCLVNRRKKKKTKYSAFYSDNGYGNLLQKPTVEIYSINPL